MSSGNTIRAIIIFVSGMLLALFLGIGIVTDQTMTLIKFIVVGGLLFCAMLGHRIWLLLLFMSAMNIPLIRGFSTIQLGQMLFLGFGLLLLLMRRLPTNFRMGETEWWRLLIGICVVQVYVRNPVGLDMFGASSVGGKAYFICSLAFISSWLFGALKVQPRELKWAMNLHLLATFIGIPIGEARNRSGVNTIQSSEIGAAPTLSEVGQATRVGFLGSIGVTLSRWISSLVHPLKACFHPFWLPLILISMACAAGSGFRNSLAMVAFTYMVGLAYRGGLASILLAFLLGSLGIATLSFVNLFAPLPANIQRALTPFPGTWEQRHKDDAKNSDEWRLEMWREALLSDRWIQNKWLGDGLGMSKLELERARDLDSRKVHEGISGISVHQENAMASGDYHGGPVQTVRIVGYVGLAILLMAMYRNAVHAHRLMMRCKGTEWYNMALYFTIPTIVNPLMFTFVFGEFEKAAAGLFMTGALIQIFHNSVPLPPYRKIQRDSYILTKQRSQKEPHTNGQS
jgi:hypothetical protein